MFIILKKHKKHFYIYRFVDVISYFILQTISCQSTSFLCLHTYRFRLKSASLASDGKSCSELEISVGHSSYSSGREQRRSARQVISIIPSLIVTTPAA